MSRRRKKLLRVMTPEERAAARGQRRRRPEEKTNLAESYRREGEMAVESKVDACIDQLRADATALETAARVLDDAPRNIFPVPHKAETVAALYALAAGMRFAADRMPDSRELPF